MAPNTLEIREELEREIAPVVRGAQELQIKTQDESLAAQDLLREIKKRQKSIDERVSPLVAHAHKAWKSIKDFENSLRQPLEAAERILKGKVIRFNDEQRRIAEEEQRKAEAARLEKERRERERLEARAKKAEESGKPEKAEALREQAESTAVMPEFTPPPPAPVVKGASIRTTWRGQITDMRAFCRAIADGEIPPNAVAPVKSILDGMARQWQGTRAFPGLRFYEEQNMSMRASA